MFLNLSSIGRVTDKDRQDHPPLFLRYRSADSRQASRDLSIARTRLTCVLSGRDVFYGREAYLPYRVHLDRHGNHGMCQ